MDTKQLNMTMMPNMNNINPSDVTFPSLPETANSDDGDQTTTNSLGFMELLGYQDYDSSYPSSIFDTMSSTTYFDQYCDNVDLDHNDHKEEFTAVDEVEEEEESSVVLNGQPSSPNCSSIFSSPDHQLHKPLQQCIKVEKTIGGDDHTKTKKRKKDKEPRFAFMTRTEIDNLNDGYRWRKYGQKAVKNSHFPRSYYRCTSASCNVKKRVERCMDDPSCVITTYEGKHNHLVTRNSTPSISSDHFATSAAFTTAPPAMLKLEQGGLLQDMLPCYH